MSVRERGIATNIAGFNMRVNTGRVRDGYANPLRFPLPALTG